MTERTTRTPGLGIWLAWIVASMIGPALGYFTATLPIDPQSTPLVLGLAALALLASIIPQWLVLRSYISELSLWSWIWAWILAGILLLLLVGLIFGLLYVLRPEMVADVLANIQEFRDPAKLRELMAADPLLKFLDIGGEIMVALIIGFAQAQAIGRHGVERALGDWTLAYVGAALVTLTGLYLTSNGQQTSVSEGPLLLVKALIYAVLTGLALILVLREYQLNRRNATKISEY